ncbi:Sin3 binding protein [Penicillium bovifimosum]|uniref:Sin3 binding protein n=1 Tax=Penicillium bovifimosum TaxID=126998 RepID=A0A9W9GW30_9EURO|nr:Sin3 binding protein [Penicillium bovifimosum]KAJ5130943.1 Sin3 binding protein [Penicillium bovifimosum]
MASQNISSIAMALAGKTASVDIPQRRSGLSGGHMPPRPGQPAMLPTPPNSISPNLPPQTFKQRVALSPGSPLSTVPQLDSDIDLQDAVDHANSHNTPQPADSLDSTGAITPAMLAKHHLPEILLQQGPLAIRHVMAHLTTSVPGFSRIPPAKARRLVVAALEGRGNGGETGGDVVFEKIGWGRWDARRRGEPAQDRDLNASASPPSSIAGSFQQRGLQIQGQSGWQGGSRHPYRMSFAESTAFSYTDDYGMHGDLDMLEHEADKMSLDGDDGEYCSSSEAPDEIQENEWDEGDATDEEDWAQIGADALRARSMNNNGSFIDGHVTARAKPQPSGIFPATCPTPAVKFAPRIFDTQERTAVEALLRLGSS